MARLFGTDGVRGVANADLTPELAFRLGRAAAYVLALGSEDGGADEDKRIAVGRDTRASGDLWNRLLLRVSSPRGFRSCDWASCPPLAWHA